MDKATQATTPTASTRTAQQAAQRAALQRARAAADRIVDRISVLPRDVEIRGDFGGAYGIRLHFGAGLTAARGVLATAGAADVQPTRDTSEAGYGVYIECTAKVDGIPLIARALVTPADADQLLQKTPTPTPAAPAAQPVRLGTSVLAHVPAVTPVAPIGGPR